MSGGLVVRGILVVRVDQEVDIGNEQGSGTADILASLLEKPVYLEFVHQLIQLKGIYPRSPPEASGLHSKGLPAFHWFCADGETPAQRLIDDGLEGSSAMPGRIPQGQADVFIEGKGCTHRRYIIASAIQNIKMSSALANARA